MLKLHIPNMACGGCARGVTAAIRGVDPDAQVVPDLQAREVEVVMVASTEATAFLSALARAGYKAQLVS